MLRRLLVALVVLVGLAGSASAYPGAPWLRPAHRYSSNFPDPSVVRVGWRYYAYGTSTGGAYLPVLTSTDLRQWVARPAYHDPANGSGLLQNDALPRPARWAVDRPGAGRLAKELWAPGVAQIGGRFVAYYAARVSLARDRFCLSVATSADPLGPFVDATAAPLHCDADPNGSIDPQPFVDADGTPYLLWKSEGDPGRRPTRIWVRRLAADGTAFARGTAPVLLLQTSQPWEGRVIENPSMVRWKGRLLLFYSGNEHASAAYATGYADCRSPVGPCTKWAGNPVLRSRGGVLGPGGAAAFVDHLGGLRLAYHWWNAPFTSYPAWPACEATRSCHTQGQRRMAVAPVSAARDGSLVVG